MDQTEVEEFLRNYEHVEPYQQIYSIYLYSMFVLSTILTILLLCLFSKSSKLNEDVRCIFLHFTFTCYAVTALVTLWQVKHTNHSKLR